MKRFLTIAATLASLGALPVHLALAANGTYYAPVQDAKQDAAKEEADLYKKFYDLSKTDIPGAMEAAKAYLQKFPNGANAAYLKKWIPSARTTLLQKATQEKNVSEIIRLSKESIAEDPEKEVDYLTFLVGQIGQNEIFAQPPNFTHATDAAGFAQRSISLIESGKKPCEPKFVPNVALGYLNYVLAVIEKNNKNIDKSLAYFQKAATQEPNNPQYFLQCGALHQQKYAAAATKFQAIPDADRDAEPDKMKPEVKSALDDVNKEADAVIQCWARFMGLTMDKPAGWEATRGQVEKVLTDLYKFRHNDSTEGLQKLIEQNRGNSSSNGASGAE